MNYEPQLQKIEETKRKTLELIADLDKKRLNHEIDGLQYKIILHDKLLGKSKEEVIAYLDNEKNKILDKIHQEKEEQIRQNYNRTKSKIAVVSILLIIIASGIILFEQNGPVGFTIRDFIQKDNLGIQTNQTFEQVLNYTNITSFKISGTIDKGSAIVKLRLLDNSELLVGNIIATNTGKTYSLTTDKKSYLLGEEVKIKLTPNDNSASTYIYKDEEQTIINSNKYTPPTIGEYKIVVILTDGDKSSRLELNFTVSDELSNQTQEEVTTTLGAINEFTDICEETCNISIINNPTIVIEPLNGATIIINNISTTTQKENNAPRQVIEIDDIQLTNGENNELDLSRYFEDADLDNIFFDITATENVTTSINGNILTITGTHIGTDFANIYATDGIEITTSNEFKITILANNNVINNTIEINQTINETNITTTDTVQNTTNISTNQTINETINLTTNLIQSENSSNISLSSCDLPIEERPTICFEGEEATFFKDIVATLTDTKGIPVGRFNRFGNLIIKGELVENSVTEPKDGDFKLGYSELINYNEKTTITAWIDKDTGDLHLKGRLYEEQQTLSPPQQSTYNINNKLGITVAYFNQKTGDLYLRGNLVRSGKV